MSGAVYTDVLLWAGLSDKSRVVLNSQPASALGYIVSLQWMRTVDERDYSLDSQGS